MLKSGGENTRQGGRMNQFIVLVLILNILQLFSEYFRDWRGGRGGGRHGHRTDSEAMGIGNSEGTSGGDGLESGGQGGAGRGERERNFSKLSKISITVTAQATAAIIYFYFCDPSPLSKALLTSTLATNLLSCLLSLSSILLKHKRPWVARILEEVGIVASALGFIQMVALSLPANLVWIVALPCLAFLLAFVMAFGVNVEY